MIRVINNEYLCEKEAASRYGFSRSWFEKRRMEKKSPSYIKLHGKILYDVKYLDRWFEENMKKIDY